MPALMIIALIILILLLVYWPYVIFGVAYVVAIPFVFPLLVYRHYRETKSFFFRFLVWVVIILALFLLAVMGLAVTGRIH